MPLTGLTVLVVEDDADSRVIMQRMLSASGATVVLAENGRDGLDKLGDMKDPPDLILCDLKMPVMDGFEFARALRSVETYCQVRLVAVTGMHDVSGHPIIPTCGH